jgi:hypothetical protein
MYVCTLERRVKSLYNSIMCNEQGTKYSHSEEESNWYARQLRLDRNELRNLPYREFLTEDELDNL